MKYCFLEVTECDRSQVHTIKLANCYTHLVVKYVPDSALFKDFDPSKVDPSYVHSPDVLSCLHELMISDVFPRRLFYVLVEKNNITFQLLSETFKWLKCSKNNQEPDCIDNVTITLSYDEFDKCDLFIILNDTQQRLQVHARN